MGKKKSSSSTTTASAAASAAGSSSSSARSDSRFDHFRHDPRFKRQARRTQGVEVDARFAGVFEDKRFSTVTTTDSRGRPLERASRDDMHRYYRSKDNGKEEEEEGERSSSSSISSSHSSGTDSEESSGEVGGEAREGKGGDGGGGMPVDYSRGVGLMESSSEEEEEEKEESDSSGAEAEFTSDEFDYDAPDVWDVEQGKEVQRSESTSNRLAICK